MLARSGTWAAIMIAAASAHQVRAEGNPFAGEWIYRSFVNDPEGAEDFNDIKLWQADLSVVADQDRASFCAKLLLTPVSARIDDDKSVLY